MTPTEIAYAIAAGYVALILLIGCLTTQEDRKDEE